MHETKYDHTLIYVYSSMKSNRNHGLDIDIVDRGIEKYFWGLM